MSPSRIRRTAVALTVFTGSCVATPVARAEILDLGAECRARVVEMNRGTTTVDEAIERYPETASVLPMHAEAAVTAEGSAAVEAIGLALSQFKDPRTVVGAIPDELNLDAAAYSGLFDVHYDVVTEVTERRTVRPTSVEAGAPDGKSVEFAGSFFIQGLLTAVSQERGRSLNGLLARVDANVVKECPVEGPQTLLSARFELVGQSDGTVRMNTGGAAQRADAIDLNLSTVAEDLGVLRVVLLPAVQFDYTYTATVGASFDLTATLRVTLMNLPDGTGVGAAFGMPGEKIGQSIDAVLGGTTGVDTVQAINTQISQIPAPAIPLLVNPPQNPGDLFHLFFGNICGLFGFESLIGLGLIGSWTGLRRVRRSQAASSMWHGPRRFRGASPWQARL